LFTNWQEYVYTLKIAVPFLSQIEPNWLFTCRWKLHFNQINISFDLNELFVVQSWGDHIDMSQAALYYFAMLGCQYVFCWLGNQLTEEVSITNAFTYISQMHTFSKINNLHNIIDNYNSVQNLTGGNCKTCSLGVRLGGNSCLISALPGLHHRRSQQGVHAHSWEICSSVKLDLDECKNSTD
jgi:hypothetical protein